MTREKWIRQGEIGVCCVGIEEQWLCVPDLRLGQLIVCALGDYDLFNMEDEQLFNLIKEFVDQQS